MSSTPANTRAQNLRQVAGEFERHAFSYLQAAVILRAAAKRERQP